MASESTGDLLTRAQAFCVSAHAGQMHDGDPFYTHPFAVADILEQQGVRDPEMLAAAYLHDVLEDTAVTRDELGLHFGENVTRLVEELTNLGPPGRTFEEKHRALAEEARRMSDRARAIKLADRLDNLRKMQGWSESARRRYAAVTAELLEALRPWPLPELGKQIEATIRPYL